jgi:hypothetical protein
MASAVGSSPRTGAASGAAVSQLEPRHLKIRLRKQIDEARSLQHSWFPTRVLVSHLGRPLERIVL